MQPLKVYLTNFINYLLSAGGPTMQPIIKDDILFDLLGLLLALTCNKFLRPLSFAFFGYMLLEYTIGTLYVVICNQWKLLFTQYVAMVAGSLIVLSFYVATYTTAHDFHNIYYDIFPHLWPMRSLGEETFKKLQKTAIILIRGYKTSAILWPLAATTGLPWYGDEYDAIIIVKIFKDVFGKWDFPWTALFYISLYHAAVTLVASATGIIYMVLHLHNQCFLLNKRLENLNSGVENFDISAAVRNIDYQDFVTYEMTCCVQHHQTLLRFLDYINGFLYYKTFYFSGSGVLTIVAVILVPKTHSLLLRVSLIGIVAAFITIAFCLLGQVVENESERIFFSAVNTPWYLWNTKNRKILLLLLLKSQDHMMLSSSGVITINFQLLIGLYQTVYSALTFVLNANDAFLTNI